MAMRTSSAVLVLDVFGLAVLAQLQDGDSESMNFKCEVGAATNLPDIVDNGGEEANDRR